jgi:hypothetical protein
MQTIEEIEGIIDAKIAADPDLAGLTSISKVADWRLWRSVVAFVQNLLSGLFDKHKEEVAGIIATQKPHTLKWYQTKALAFQWGDALPADSDVYVPVVPGHLIVSNAAAVELVGKLRIKVAKGAAGALAPLAVGELTSFTAYMKRVKDAGVRIECTSGAGDDLRLHLVVYYDPLIIAADGSRIDGTAPTPIKDATNAFLASLPFNGLFVLNYMIAALQAVEGVRIGEVTYCAARFGMLPYNPIAYEYNPDAGYLVLDAADFVANTSYLPHDVI